MIKRGYTVDLGMISRFRSLFAAVICIICAAVSVSAQEIISIPSGSGVKQVVVIPPAYIIDSSFKELGSVQSGRLKKDDGDADFDPLLEKLVAEVASKGGNVLQLSRVEDHKQSGRYRFWGEAYNTDNFEQIKGKITAAKSKKFSEACAYVTIYRPAYNLGFNDSIRFQILINDTLSLMMQSNARYILKVRKEGRVRITVKHKDFIQNLVVDARTGNEYYVRSYTNFPGAGKYLNTGDMKMRVKGYTPYLEKIEDPVQGNVESSMVTQVVVTKKI